MIFIEKLKFSIIFFSVLSEGFVIVYCLRHGKSSPLFRAFMFFQFMIFLWSVRYVLDEGLMQWTSTVWYGAFKYLPTCLIGYAFFKFSALYTQSKLGKPWLFKAMLVLAMVVYGMIVINLFTPGDYTKGVSKEIRFEWINYLYILITYIYSFFALMIMMRYSIQQYGVTRAQSILLGISSIGIISLNILGNILAYFEGIQVVHELTSAGSALSGVLLCIAVFRYRFLNIAPIARNELFDCLDDAVFVFDDLGNLIKHNEMCIKLIGAPPEKKCPTKELFYKCLHTILKSEEENICEEKQWEKILNTLGSLKTRTYLEPFRYYEISQKLIYGPEKRFVGFFVIAKNITQRQKMIDEIRKKNSALITKNKELRLYNKQLESYFEIMEELTITKERNRLARDLHDALGSSMVMMISLLENCKRECDTNDKVKKLVAVATETARTGLAEIRKSIYKIADSTIDHGNIEMVLNKLINSFKPTGLGITLISNGLSDYRNTIHAESIFKICQEAITNASKHGEANHVSIVIKKDSAIKLFITNDGKGCKTVSKGIGLKGIEYRVQALNGKIEYGSDGEVGFNIFIQFPLGGAI